MKHMQLESLYKLCIAAGIEDMLHYINNKRQESWDNWSSTTNCKEISLYDMKYSL